MPVERHRKSTAPPDYRKTMPPSRRKEIREREDKARRTGK